MCLTCVSSYKVKACFIIGVFTVFIFGGSCLNWESFYVMCSIFLYKEPLYFFIICFEFCVFCVKHSVFIFRGNRLRWESFYVVCLTVFFMFLCFCVLCFKQSVFIFWGNGLRWESVVTCSLFWYKRALCFFLCYLF